MFRFIQTIIYLVFLIDPMMIACRAKFQPNLNFQSKLQKRLYCSKESKDTISPLSEFIIASSNRLDLDNLKTLRPNTQFIVKDHIKVQHNSLVWTAFRNNVLIDYAILNNNFKGKTLMDDKENAVIWNNAINRRLVSFNNTSNQTISSKISLGYGRNLQTELDAAISVVHQASFLARHLQTTRNDIINKLDDSPVTLADFAVQAIILDTLSNIFPNDLFIAEEESSNLQTNELLTNTIISYLETVQGKSWNKKKLFDTIDKGSYDGSVGRVWVLDPIDGTKGFIRGEHYCIALALLENGIPILSVMGCPNLNLNRVINRAKSDEIGLIDEGFEFFNEKQELLKVSSLDSGSIYFAATGCGSYAKSLSMVPGAGLEVQVSDVSDTKDATLGESAEASFGSRKTTSKVCELLNLKNDYVRLDGQCKVCVVGSGGAEGNLRLPPDGYQEKIWDHAPAYHFLTESGGRMTDLENNKLDFTQGRSLSKDVKGIIASNGILHNKILNAVNEAKI